LKGLIQRVLIRKFPAKATFGKLSALVDQNIFTKTGTFTVMPEVELPVKER